MGLRLSVRLTILMVVLALFSACFVALVTYRNMERALVAREMERLRSEAARLASRLETYVAGGRSDLLALEAALLLEPAALAAIEAGASLTAQQRARLEGLLLSQLGAKANYSQIRLIGLARGGRELVRVERTGAAPPLVVDEDALQEKGQRDYFIATMALEPSEVHVSPIEPNVEHGVIELPHRPVLRVAKPLYFNGRPLGALVINLDMRPPLELFRTGTGDRITAFLVNDAGDYLASPDPAMEFGSQLGTGHRWRSDLPELAATSVRSLPNSGFFRGPDGETALSAQRVELPGGQPVAVLATAPAAAVRAPVASIVRTTALPALGAVLVAVGLASLFARSVTRPLAKMTVAAQALADGRVVDVPTEATGELGVLARGFARMATEVRDKTAALTREIEQRKASEELLSRQMERERQLAAVVESSSDAIFAKDRDGVILSWNPGAAQLYGYSEAEAVGQHVSMLVPDDRKEELQRISRRLAAGERIAHFETVRVTRAGKRVDVSLTLSPLRNADGVVIGASAIGRDVTARRLAEERLHQTFEASPAGMLVIDQHGTIQLANSEIERMLGYPHGELLGQSVDGLVPAAVRPAHGAQRAAYLADPRSRPMGEGRDLRALTRDGREVPVEIGLTPIRTDGGLVVLATVVDISERVHAAAAEAQYVAELKRSNEELEQFAYVASHDLQEPLRMVVSYTELLAERYRGRLDDKADKFIAYAVDGGRRMQRLVADLLAYSRVGSQGAPFETVEVGALLEQVVKGMSRQIEEAGTKLEWDRLPTVSADPVQLGQLLQNLIANAVKFRESRPPIVHVAAVSRDGEWLFSVADNGIGIEPGQAERVFQMFQRLHERGRYEGSGMGLAIAKRIVQRHRGRIWFESEPGQGSTFYFTLPMAS